MVYIFGAEGSGTVRPPHSPDGLPDRETMKGVVRMSVYEALILMIAFATLIAVILRDNDDERK
jgi:hypothetical protein